MNTITTRILVLALLAGVAGCKKDATTDTGNTTPITVTLSPSAVTLDQGATQTFTGHASRGNVTYTVSSTGGSIDSSGHYTAPYAQGSYTVLAASTEDTSKTAAATVTVNQITITLSPDHARLAPGATATFTATVTGAVDKSVTWTTDGGTIDSTGNFTAGTSTGSFTVTAASTRNPARKATAAITVTTAPPPAVTVSPTAVAIDQGGSQQFTATVANVTDTSVTWSIDPATGGSITSDGLFTAGTVAQDVNIIATSVEDPSASGTAVATINGVHVTVAPSSVSLAAGATQTFTATVTGTNNTAVTWSLGAGSNGAISSDGVYTAPTTVAATDTIIATSVADPSVNGSGTATVISATGFVYTDPSGTGWRLVKNASSTSTHLILDLVAPSSTSGRGLGLTLSADQGKVTWVKVDSGDAELVKNHLLTLGTGTPLLKAAIKGNALAIGAFQKGAADAAASYTGPILSVALDLKPTGNAPGGVSVPLSVLKANALDGSGAGADITLAVGTLVTQ
ncbi:MAG: Ig-like domain-containing protein [Deltaproteobacteria bacterium]|nr:Ig-like domain-containing protein [Deltaproteobacteria bacterium]